MRRGSRSGGSLGRRRLLAVAPAALLFASLIGCPGPDNPYRPYPEPDFDQFVSEVQPVLARSCSNLGCHGDPDRRLTLYSVEYLRAEPAVPGSPLDSDRLAAAELGWNFDSMRARLIDEVDADEARLLLKCLDPEVGGIEHAEGEVVWTSADEPDYVALRDWIETGL